MSLYEIHTIDLLYQDTPETIAAYLILGPEAPILIETGPASTLDNLKAGLAQHNVSLSDIQHVLVTHIHLDHSGAAGWLAKEGAHIYVHHVGARHLVDPSKLIASASRIYLNQMDTLWGTTIDVPEGQVTAVTDNETLNIGGLTFKTVDTPGHAWHHMAYQLDDNLFAGDSMGNRLNKRPYTVLPAPPPEFKLDVWQQTVEKVRQAAPKTIYPTHFGAFHDVTSHLDMLEQLLHDSAHFVLDKMQAQLSRDEIIEAYRKWDIARGQQLGISESELKQYIVSNPLHMSVDGIMRYWTRIEKSREERKE